MTNPTQPTPCQQWQTNAAGAPRFNVADGSKFRLVVPFTKTEKLDDGRLMVEGVATSEAVDSDGEVMDYASAKAAFAAWPGNIREQHDPKKAVGRAVEIMPDDATKTIILRSFISSGAPDTQAKILDGTLSCYSIGGTVAKRTPEKATKADGTEVDVRRVILGSLTETSVVDQGANPETGIALVKADGAGVLIGVGLADARPTPDTETDVELEVTGTDDEVAEFAKTLNASGLTMADAIAAIRAAGAKATAADTAPAAQEGAGDTQPAAKASEAQPAATEAPAAESAPATVAKGVYTVQEMAGALWYIAGICASAENDAQWEGDGSPVPAALREWLASGVAIFNAMAAEEFAELLANLKNDAGEVGETIAMAIGNAAGVTKLRKRLADPALTVADASAIAKEYDEPLGDGFADRVIAKAGARNNKSDAATIQKMHDHAVNLGAKCAAGDKAAGAGDDVTKAAGGELAKVSGQLAEALARLEKLEKQPMPVRTMALAGVKVVSKADDAAAAAEIQQPFAESEYVRNPDGTINAAATATKFVQFLGGRRVTVETLAGR